MKEHHSASIVNAPSHARTEVTDVLAVCEVASELVGFFLFFFTHVEGSEAGN